jgi:hypothetical protein
MGLLGQAMPGLRGRFSTHAAFSKVDVSGILDTQFSKTQQVQVNTLVSMVFLNRGGRFEAVRLPDEAQFAPAFGLNVMDIDGDGHEDLFVSQNFFGLRNEEPRCDAGRGLCLRGDGSGRFKAVSGQECGIKIYGEQRGSAACDFDQDGRVDLVVAQNSSETKLFRNIGAKPGLRLRLRGPPLNPSAIGAAVRLKFGERLGPARAIHGGSGYWSQDSAIQVLATPEAPTDIWVRWPGGSVSIVPVKAGSPEVMVSAEAR